MANSAGFQAITDLPRYEWEWTDEGDGDIVQKPTGDFVRFSDVVALLSNVCPTALRLPGAPGRAGSLGRGPLGAIIEEAFTRPDSHVDGTEDEAPAGSEVIYCAGCGCPGHLCDCAGATS